MTAPQPPLFLSEMSFETANGYFSEECVGFLPTGATEAHGPHLPLSTDVIISRHSAAAAARKWRALGHRAVVMPPIAYAVTEFAANFSGTVSIGLETATSLIRDVITGAKRAGIAHVVICNAHLEPGNIRALIGGLKAAKEAGASAAFPDITRKPHALKLGDEFKSGACHAGRYETSLVLAASPYSVDQRRASDLAPNPSSLSVAIREGKGSFEEAGGPDAYFGYPHEATPSEGAELTNTLADIYLTGAFELTGKEQP